MNCEETINQLPDYTKGALPKVKAIAIAAHIETCASCQQVLEEENRLKNLLAELPIPVNSGNFIDQALEIAVKEQTQLENQASQHKRSGFVVGFSSALAAGIALWAMVSLFPMMGNPELEQDNGIRIALHETHHLKLAFYSEHAISGANISINLPENIALVGYPGQRILAWKINLVKGDNLLTLPIKAIELQSGELIANIEHNNENKMLKVRLKVLEPGMTENAVSVIYT